MKLPQREFYTLHEAAARWGCALADISGWSTAGELDVITGIPPTFCGTTRVAGTVVICTMDIAPMFRRCGTGPKNAQLRRLRTEEAAEWLFVTEPAQGVEVSVADLLLRSKQVLKFEDTHDLLRRISGGTGSTSPYDWDGMTKAFLIRIHDRGIPTSKAEMIGDLQDWFVANSNGDDIPSERSIRRHVDDLWKMLTALKRSENTRSAGPRRPSQSQLSKEKMMKPNASTAADTPDTDTGDDPAPVALPTPNPPAPPTPAPAPAPASDGDAAAFATSLARAEAAELATIGAQAARLGVNIDVAEAVQKGIKPDALRASVLNQLAARGDAAAIAVVPPPKSAAPESPLLAAVKRAASAGKPA